MHTPTVHGTRQGNGHHMQATRPATIARSTMLLCALLTLTLLAGCREPGAFDGGWGAGLPSSITIEKTHR